MKAQNFLFFLCMLTFSVNSYPQNPNSVRVSLRTVINEPLDNIVIRFFDDSTVTYEESSYWDVRSLNLGTFIASMKGNVSLAINTRPLNFMRDSVCLRVESPVPGNYRFVFTGYLNFVNASEIYLLDNYTGTRQEVKTSPLYDFNITTDPLSKGTSRFKLVFVSEQVSIVCPPPLIVNNDIGMYGANVDFSALASAKCSGTYLSYGAAPNSFFPVGTTTVPVTAYDSCGNTASCSVSITVNDTEPPVILTPNYVFNTDAGLCTASEPDIMPFVSDNSGDLICNGIRSDGALLNAPFGKGETIVTWTAKDAAGNISSALQVITVIDNELPVILPKEPHTVTANFSGCTYKVPDSSFDLSATDNCSIISLKNNMSNSNSLAGIVLPVGPNMIIWTATDDAGNNTTYVQYITVLKPVIQGSIPDAFALQKGVDANTMYIGYLPASQLQLNAVFSQYLGYQWSAAPNLFIIGSREQSSVTIAAGVVSSGTYPVSLTVTDTNGCSNEITKQLTVVDIRCGNKGDRISICSPLINKQLCANVNVLSNYLLSGFILGNCITSRNEQEEMQGMQTISAYPNPSTGIFSLQMDNYAGEGMEIRVVDMSGKLVFNRPVIIKGQRDKIKIDLGGKPAGIYNVQVVTKKGSRSFRILVAG